MKHSMILGVVSSLVLSSLTVSAQLPRALAQHKVKRPTQQAKAAPQAKGLRLAQVTSSKKTAAKTATPQLAAGKARTMVAQHAPTPRQAMTTEVAPVSTTPAMSLTTQAPKTEEKKKFAGSWVGGLETASKTIDDGDATTKLDSTENQMTGVLGVKLGYNFSDSLNMSFNPSIVFVSGHLLGADEKGGKPTDTKLGVSEAAATFAPNNQVKARLGIMRQLDLIHSPIVMFKSAFPTARLGVSTDEKADSNVGFIAQASIPVSYTLSTRTKEGEAMPSMIGAGLNGKLKASVFEFSGKLSAFQFNNLPSGLAKAAEENGNSVVANLGATPEDVTYAFVYKYRGIDATLGAGVELTNNLKFNLAGSYTKNNDAPDKMNVGTYGETSIEYSVGDNLVIIPNVSVYRVEPDAVVAQYGAYNTNKAGYDAGIKLKTYKVLNIAFSGGEADRVYLKKDQFYSRSYSITFETEPIPF